MNTSEIFNINNDVAFLPNQVFAKKDFTFLLTYGGNLADDEIEYQRLMSVLKRIGETEFFVVENTDDENIFNCTISTNSDFELFNKYGMSFDENFGWTLSSFFVFGLNNNWGIYMSECPTINIIGCNKELVDVFQNAYDINENGYAKVKEFVQKEFLNNDLVKVFEKNYNLN